jgi:hemoglobin-like flavoprotein
LFVGSLFTAASLNPVIVMSLHHDNERRRRFWTARESNRAQTTATELVVIAHGLAWRNRDHRGNDLDKKTAMAMTTDPVLRHQAAGVRPRQHRSVGEALMQALAAQLRSAWTPATESAWRRAYNLVAEIMIAESADLDLRSTASTRDHAEEP